MEILRSSNFETIPGMGTIALIDGKVSAIGSKKMIEHFYVRDTYDKCYVENLEFRGQTVMFVIIDDCIVGIVCTTDRIKETTPKALVKLHQLHVKVFMLTGDNRQVASAVSNELKLDGFEAEYLPEDKLNKVKALQQEGYTVGMAGHTIADVKAIEEADVCIAMGTKNDVIVKSADAVLLEDDLLELERAKVLSVDIVRNIKQNLFFAFIYNFIAIPFAAFGFLNPIFADIAMVLSTVSVVLNALRLKKMNIG